MSPAAFVPAAAFIAPRLLTQVVDPLGEGEALANHPFDWHMFNRLILVIDHKLLPGSSDLEQDILPMERLSDVIMGVRNGHTAMRVHPSGIAPTVQDGEPVIRVHLRWDGGQRGEHGKGRARWLIAAAPPLMGSLLVIKALEVARDGAYLLLGRWLIHPKTFLLEGPVIPFDKAIVLR